MTGSTKIYVIKSHSAPSEVYHGHYRCTYFEFLFDLISVITTLILCTQYSAKLNDHSTQGDILTKYLSMQKNKYKYKGSFCI